MKKKLLIIGASGHGKVVADIAKAMNKWEDIFFLDDDKDIKSTLGIKKIGKTEDYNKYIEEYNFFIAIGDNEVREKIHKELKSNNATIETLIHPNAVIGTNVKIGKGTVIMPGAVINSESKIGESCIINTGTNIDHDTNIDDFVHVSPGVSIAGEVIIGKNTWLGIGSTVINNINIGNNTMIGAGAVIVKDIPDNCTAVGNPAKPIKFHN